MLTPAQRTARHRAKQQAAIDAMPKVTCACGCGTPIPPINKQGKPAKFAHGHNGAGTSTRFKQGVPSLRKGVPNPRARDVHLGKKLPPELLAKMKAARIAKYGSYTRPDAVKAGIQKRPTSWKANVAAALRQRDYRGERNPFYGKKHPPELQEQISAKIRGPLHPNWNGGVATLPYGPEFTRRFKALIRNRDGHRCLRCGTKRKKGARTLDVHHIDHNKLNNDPANLATVCGSCNVWLSYHRDQPFQRALLQV
jgi:5-methylcytosine-specific restriction endonuclease McrA